MKFNIDMISTLTLTCKGTRLIKALESATNCRTGTSSGAFIIFNFTNPSIQLVIFSRKKLLPVRRIVLNFMLISMHIILITSVMYHWIFVVKV